mgnify:CR=1 FL=1
MEAGAADEAECAAIAEEVSQVQAECAEDLEKAEPIIQEAEAALNSLDKKSLGELKAYSNVDKMISAVTVTSRSAIIMNMCAPA